jgi:D-glycero-alpha-D-manno-heptose-7-phosphate kinase
MRAKKALADDAIHVEQELLQEAVGAQDQICAAYGGFNRINFYTDGTYEVKRVVTSPTRLAELEQHLALYFTGFARTASEIAQEQIRLTSQRKHELDAMLKLVDEAETIIASPGRSLEDFGRLLHEGWRIKRSLTQKITNAAIDEIYEAGRGAGALGGKLLGAGGGGFMLFFVPPERRQELRTRLKRLLCVPFTLSNRGSHIVVYEPEKPYDKSLTGERRAVYASPA